MIDPETSQKCIELSVTPFATAYAQILDNKLQNDIQTGKKTPSPPTYFVVICKKGGFACTVVCVCVERGQKGGVYGCLRLAWQGLASASYRVWHYQHRGCGRLRKGA